MSLISPVFSLETLYSTEMLLVVSNGNHISFATCDTYHQVKVLNNLANTLQSKFLAAEGFGYLVYADNSIIANQHLGFGYLLLAITFRSAIGSIEQLNGRNGRDTAQLVVLNATQC